MIKFVHPTLAEYRRRPAHPNRREGGKRLRHGEVRAPDDGRPLVTIVTSVRNSDEFLARSIDSVLAQTYPHVEYVVADGGSTDDTVKIVERYGDDIDYWVSEPDQSMFDGMNRGIAKATGRLVRIHGADDLIPLDATERAVEAFMALSDRASTVIRGDMELIDMEGVSIQIVREDHRQLGSMPIIVHPTWYVPMEIYERWGLYDPNTVVSSDYEMYFYLLQQGVRFEHLSTVLSQFRTGGTSSTFAGLIDGFLINRRYQGLPKAVGLVAAAGGIRAGRLLVESALGKQGTVALRRRVKELLAR